MEQLNPNLFKFLRQLKKNNNRDWFDEHKPEFLALKKSFSEWVEAFKEELDPLDEIERAKIFRIYRDVRFSKDKTPYKTHFSVNFMRMGQDHRGSYYLHLEPGNSFAAAGFYGPEKDDLYRIRKEFELDDQRMREILSSKDVQAEFDGKLQGDELKTAPRDFDREDPAIDLIRKKQFYFSKPFSDQEVFSPQFHNQVLSTFSASLPFLDYMSEVLTTNMNGEKI